MKQVIRFFLLLAVCAITFSVSLNAQNLSIGTLHYSLPMTSFVINIETEVESFIPGPYAEYASQYFDYSAATKNTSVCKVSKVSIVPTEVIDNTLSFSISLNSKNGSAEALQVLNNKGYVYIADNQPHNSITWEFGNDKNDNPFVGKGLDIQSVTNTKTVYEKVETEDGVENVPVSKSEEVKLTEPMKAEELAKVISDLKQSRIDIITGNTDAEFQGEAMTSVISEINRLIDQYSSLFYGIESVDKQSRTFEVVPTESNFKSIVICKVSDTKGILPADSKEGRPVTLSVSRVDVPDNGIDNVESWLKGGSGVFIKYRVPVYSYIRIMDGETVLMDAYLPIFQFGAMSSIAL